jgi:putative transposase
VRRSRINEKGPLSIRRQCKLLKMHRRNVYYQPASRPLEDVELMRLIDEEYLRHPFYGSRQMTLWLCGQGHEVNRKRVQRLMRLMGLQGLAPGPSTSRPHPEHKVYPYLLRGVEVTRANQVWATDITYVPMARGFACVFRRWRTAVSEHRDRSDRSIVIGAKRRWFGFQFSV